MGCIRDCNVIGLAPGITYTSSDTANQSPHFTGQLNEKVTISSINTQASSADR